MKKRIVTIALVIALLATCFAGTYAYLTDTKAAVNTMVVGEVHIEQIELQRKDGIDYKNGGAIADGDELETFQNGQVLFPTHYTEGAYTAKNPNNEQFWWGPYVTADVTGNGSSNGLWDDALTGAMDKFVFVQNTGDRPCYYRTIIALECPDGTAFSDNPDKEFMMNVNLNDRFTRTEKDYIYVNGVRYCVIVFTYNKVLEANTISRPSLLQVVMTHKATNDTIRAIGSEYTILALSQAVQSEGFSSADQALNAAFGELTEANIIAWLEEAYPANP